MGMAPHIKCCGCCCTLHMGAMIGSALYIVYLLISVVVFPAIWPSPGVKEAKMFCSGTTAAYRKGNDVNSALTPSITLHPSITHALLHPSIRAACTRRRLPA